MASRLKQGLLEHISKEQFGFLLNRQILNAIGSTQEGIHTIKKYLSFSFEIGFDRIDWTFLRLILLKIGMSLNVTNWIMGCITTTNFATISNGGASKKFKVSRGIKQGHPLSPFLFLLAIEVLSLLMAQAKGENKVRGKNSSP